MNLIYLKINLLVLAKRKGPVIMNCQHELCAIRHNLEMNRRKLEELISSNPSNLLSNNVIKVSQNLDELLVRCMQCKTIHNIIDILDVNSVAGRHSMFFYYGKEHLLVCLAKYIKQGIDKNEFCPIFIQPDWFQSLDSYLSHINRLSRNIVHYPMNLMLESFMNGGYTAFRKKVLELEKWAEDEGFSGIRLMAQCSYAIELTSKSDFLKFEKVTNDAFSGTKVSALCTYDFYEFINTSKYIDDDIVCDSFKTHTNLHLHY